MTTGDATVLKQAREVRRCLDSSRGLLEAICERMPPGAEARVLRAHIEGGEPETSHLIDEVVRELGGPGRDVDARLSKSFPRGYQVAVLMMREDVTGVRDPAAWEEDPSEFVARECQEPPRPSGVAVIAAERLRQIEEEGFNADRDDVYVDGDLAAAAACYLIPGKHPDELTDVSWPWALKWWKPTPDDRIRELAKAGALIAAEIDRLQRAAEGGGS